jgi:type I restriction enzyme S subunit
LKFDYTYKAHPSVIRDTYKDLSFPSIEKQNSVVCVFNKLEKIISKRKSQLAQLNQLVKSQFVEMFGDTFSNPMGWPSKTFEEAGKRLSDGPFGSNLKSSHYSDSGIRVIRLGNIGVGKFIDEDRAFIPREHYEKLKKYTCRAGEIVIGTLGDPNLRACLVPANIDVAVNKSDCVHYLPKKELLDEQYVCWYLNAPGTLKLAASMIHGQTRSRVSSGQIARMPIRIPPLALQREFAAFVEKVEKLKDVAKKSVEEMDTLYRAKLQEYFG